MKQEVGKRLNNVEKFLVPFLSTNAVPVIYTDFIKNFKFSENQ